MEFKNSETLKNLTRSFLTECMDGAKYQFLADIATQQKMSEVSQLLKDLATNEMAHAKIWYDHIINNGNKDVEMVDIKATIPMNYDEYVNMLNIESDLEKRQAETIYPAFAKIASKEGFDDVANDYLEIAKIELEHSNILQKLYISIKNNNLYESNQPKLWICKNCGHEATAKKAWKKCPLCDKDQGYVKILFESHA